jgi:hypothetical protein
MYTSILYQLYADFQGVIQCNIFLHFEYVTDLKAVRFLIVVSLMELLRQTLILAGVCFYGSPQRRRYGKVE